MLWKARKQSKLLYMLETECDRQKVFVCFIPTPTDDAHTRSTEGKKLGYDGTDGVNKGRHSISTCALVRTDTYAEDTTFYWQGQFQCTIYT